MSAEESDPPPRARFAVVRNDASEQIASELRLYVHRNGLRPGDRIGTEHELAREFGVSRATIREGIRLLAGANLVRSTQGRSGGIFVANTLNESLSQSLSEGIGAMIANQSISLEQLLSTRMMLEVPLAGLAAERADDRVIAELERTAVEMENSLTRRDAFNHADMSFHRIVGATAGNELMLVFTHWTLSVLRPSLFASVGETIDRSELIRQHRAILGAIKRRQSRGAERAMARHLEYIKDAAQTADDAAGGGTGEDPTRLVTRLRGRDDVAQQR